MRSRLLPACMASCLVALIAFAPPASAGGDGNGTPPESGEFSCRASGVRLTSPIFNSEPIVSNKQQIPCEDDTDRLALVTLSVLFRAAVIDTATDAQPGGSAATASATTAVVRLGGAVITADVLLTTATASCQNGAPAFTGSSAVSNLTINGQKITVVDQPVVIPANPLVVVAINERTTSADGTTFTVRALRVTSALLGTEIVVSESVVDVRNCPKPPPPPPQCSDKQDNDKDDHIDWPADPGCRDEFDDDETDDPKPYT